MTTIGYDPNRTRVSDDTQAQWLRSPIKGNVTEVPGIGNATATLLAECEDNITTTYQLLGKYLSFKEHNVSTIEHADRFFYWLEYIGTPTGHRSSIVRAIAEKLQLQFPDIYDEYAYVEETDKKDDKDSSEKEWKQMQKPNTWWGIG